MQVRTGAEPEKPENEDMGSIDYLREMAQTGPREGPCAGSWVYEKCSFYGTIPLKCATVSLHGRKCEGWPKPTNQDSYTLNSNADFPIFGVFDGHGSVGHAVSDYVRDEIAKRMPLLLHQLAEVPKESLAEKARKGCEKLFRKIESRLREQSMKWQDHIDTSFSGTTAVVVFSALYCVLAVLYVCSAV
jgi:hypothetical protein